MTRSIQEVTDFEFLGAHNDLTLSNQALCDKLDVEWTAIGVKLRSPRLMLHRTVVRAGGSKGTVTAIPEDSLPEEARLWLKDGTIQPQPASGSYIPLASRTAETSTATTTDATTPAAISTEGAGDAAMMATTGSDSDAPAAPAASTTEPAQPAAGGVSFKVNMQNTVRTFTGPNIVVAVDGFVDALIDANMSKVLIHDQATGAQVGPDDIVDGGVYSVRRQLTAAREVPALFKRRFRVEFFLARGV